MMGGLLQFLAGPVKVLMDGAQGIISEFVTSPEQKLAAQEALLNMQEKLNESMMQSDAAFVQAQASVVTTELQSESWLARNWRPMLMLVFTYIIAHTYVIAPLFSVKSVEIPPDMWELLKIGMGGYVFGRTLEKITPDIAAAIGNRKDANMPNPVPIK